MHFLAVAVIKKTVWNLVRALGGPGLILLGLADNSAIPLPGSMDALTIVLAASHSEWWWITPSWLPSAPSSAAISPTGSG